VKAKEIFKPGELVQRGLSDGAERVGQNIREDGELSDQEEQPENQPAYAVNRTEATAVAAARTAYVLGRKMAEQKLKQKKEQQPEATGEAGQQQSNGEPVPELEAASEIEPVPEIEVQNGSGHYIAVENNVPDIKQRVPEDKMVPDKRPELKNEVKNKAKGSGTKEKNRNPAKPDQKNKLFAKSRLGMWAIM